MDEYEVRSERLVALCLLGFVLFNYPLLSLFNVPATVFGVPVLYAYIFVSWAAVIGILAWIIEASGRRSARGRGRE